MHTHITNQSGAGVWSLALDAPLVNRASSNTTVEFVYGVCSLVGPAPVQDCSVAHATIRCHANYINSTRLVIGLDGLIRPVRFLERYITVNPCGFISAISFSGFLEESKMGTMASQAALGLREDRTRRLSQMEKQARDIAESPQYREEWNRVAEIARTVPTMPLLLRVCMDRPVVSHDFWQRSAVVAFAEEAAIMAAVELEARHPKYLPLPPVLAALENHPLLEAGRALGRCLYREVMYFEDEESGKILYDPLRFDQQEVFDFVDGSIRPQDRRVAAMMPLPLRVGRVVGFLSGLSVAQPDEARNGMVILARLVAPLLVNSELAPAGNRAARRAAARRKSLPAPRT